MHTRTNPKTHALSKRLRQRLTFAEDRLWKRLRAHRLAGVGFRRQHAVGPYIVDFCAPRQKLIIELDGAQHARQVGRDARRSDYLQSRGYRLLRFSNAEVVDSIEDVMQRIAEETGLSGDLASLPLWEYLAAQPSSATSGLQDEAISGESAIP
jgi:very-short-patch-repair endonuclease